MKTIDFLCKFINKQEQANLIDAESASTIPETSDGGNNRHLAGMTQCTVMAL